MKARFRAFSLVEVLVVIAIIAILASFIFPVFAGVKNKALETGCTSNLHQLYLAAQLYREDHGDYPPVPGQQYLDTYLRGGVLHCPAQTNRWIAFDYFVNGPPLASMDPNKEEGEFLAKAWQQCRVERGQDFPAVWDSNHATALADVQTHDAFYLIARESGQIQRVEAAPVQTMLVLGKPPCDYHLGVSNF